MCLNKQLSYFSAKIYCFPFSLNGTKIEMRSISRNTLMTFLIFQAASQKQTFLLSPRELHTFWGSLFHFQLNDDDDYTSRKFRVSGKISDFHAFPLVHNHQFQNIQMCFRVMKGQNLKPFSFLKSIFRKEEIDRKTAFLFCVYCLQIPVLGTITRLFWRKMQKTVLHPSIIPQWLPIVFAD